MSKKWRVEYDGHFLGHFPARNVDQAIDKAIVKSKEYYPQVLDFDKAFSVTQGKQKYLVMKG